MEIGVSTWSLHREFASKAVDGLSFPSLSVEAFGITQLEYVEFHVGSREKSYLGDLREALRKAGCQLTSFTLGNEFSMVSDSERAEEVEKVKKSIEVAAELGAKSVRVNAGWRSAEDAAEGRVIKAVQECLPLAKEKGLKITVENHGGISYNPDAVVRMVKGVGSDSFGTCPDFGNLALDDRLSGLEKIFRFALHAHAKSLEFDDQGSETTIDFPRVIEIAKRSGYDGVMSIEFEGKGDEREGVLKTKKLLERLL